MLLRVLTSYLALEIVIVAAALGLTLWGRRRRLRTRHKVSLAGFVRTDETFFDPTTGIRQQVWFNPETGERRYETIDGPTSG